jgi:hypothetical protein
VWYTIGWRGVDQGGDKSLKRPALRIAVQITLIVVLVGLAALVVGPIRGELERRFVLFRDEAIAELEGILGREISYAEISPSILRYLSVRDLTVHGRPGEPADLLTVEQLKIYYRPLALLRGEFSEAFSEVRLENTRLAIDTSRDTDLVAIVSDILGASEARGGSPIPPDLVVSGHNITLDVISELGDLAFEDVFFETSVTNGSVSLRGEGDVAITGLPADLPITSINGRVQAAGTVELSTGNALFDLTVPELRSDIASLEGQVFQVSYADGTLEARKIRDRNPVDLYFRLQTEPMELYARVLSDGYRLSDLVRLEGEFAEYNRYIESPIRGQANATMTADSFSYDGSVRTRFAGLPGLEIPSGDVTVRFSGDAREVEVESLAYTSGVGELEFSGVVQLEPFRPNGRVRVRNLVYGGIAPLSLTADILSRGDTIAVDTNRFTYAGVTVARAEGFVTLGESPYAEATVALGPEGDRRLEISTEHARDGTLLRVGGDARSVRPAELERLQAALLPDLQLPDISVLPPSLRVDARVLADLTGPLTVSVPLFYAVEADNPDNHVSFSLDYSGEEVFVRDAEASYNGYSGRGDFVARIGRGGSVTFESDVVVEDIPYQFTGVYDPSDSLEILGNHDVDARFYFGQRDELIFAASGDIPIPLTDSEDVRIAFDANGYVFSGEDWLVNVDSLQARGIPYLAVETSDVGLSGSFGPTGGRLETATYRDPYSELEGSGRIDWDLEELAGRLEMVLSDADGLETYTAVASFAAAVNPFAGGESLGRTLGNADGALFAGATLDLTAGFTRLPLLRAGIETLRGGADGSVRVSGSPGELVTELTARLREGRFNGDPVEIAGTLVLGPSGLTVTDASGRYQRTRFENVQGRVSLEEGTAELSGGIFQPREAEDLAVDVVASGSFDSELRTLSDVVRTGFSARAVLSNLPVEEDLPSEWQFMLKRADGSITLAGGPADAITGAIDDNGDFRLALKSPVPLSFSAVGSLTQGRIEADLINVEGDVSRLWKIVDSPGLNFTSGTATGSVRIVGPLNDPDYYGTLVASNVTGTVDIVSDLIGPMRTFLVFDEKVLTIRETTAPAGTGRARISAAVTLDRWLPDEFRVWITTLEGTPVRVANDFGGVAIDGFASGSLLVAGGPDSLEITGDLTGSSMAITLSEVEEGGGPDPEAGDLIADVNVTTGRGVQFLWPTDAFPILRGFADVGETVRITHRRSTGSYSVTGPVAIQGGEVFYFDRSFYIREGRMVFSEDQTGFDPLLTVDAEIREVGPDGPVRIYLVAAESPLSQFTPQWRSDPPLTEAEIIALLGGNVFVTDEGDPINLSQAVLLTSDLVSQFGLIRGFETSIRDALQLDLFSIRTQLFQNLIRGVIDQAQYPLDTDVPSLGEYLDNTTLFLGKYLGSDLFLELLVQLRAADPVAETTRSLAGIAVDSELSLEWETPFFLLEWSFFPTDPSSLFLTDNTISFSWEYSY